MRLSNIAHLYLVRLKARVVLVQELFAVLGIAVGVALLFASQVASTSLSGSIAQLTSGVIGQTQYQLKARGPDGFSQSLLGEVQHLRGVRAAVPVVEEQTSVTGPKGTRAVDLIATDPHFIRLAGPLLRHFNAAMLATQDAIALPAPIGEAIGVGALETAKLQLGARVVPALVGVELTTRNIGPLVHSPIVYAPLAYAQKVTDMRGRLTRIFLAPWPGHAAEVHAGLLRIAQDDISVEPADFDATVFNQASEPNTQATLLFSAICALVGFMFAFNAMLLTMHLRRGLVRELRRAGSTRWETIKALLFDALVLGSVATLLGLALGDALSILAFHAAPGYLTFAFPVGTQRVVTWQSVAIAAAAGMLAACVGVLTPLRTIWTRSALREAPHGHALLGFATLARLFGGVVCLGGVTAILLTGVRSVQVAVLGVVCLVSALLLLLPVLIDAIVAAVGALQGPFGTAAGELALAELRSPETRARSLAIAATGAIAVFGSVAIQGGQTNLQHGLDELFQGVTAAGPIWVVPPGEQNLLATASFRDTASGSIARVPGVAGVHTYHAGFLEYGDRRVWVLAPPGVAGSPLPPGQIVKGDSSLTAKRLREGGWAAVSQTLAEAQGLHIGERFTLPSAVPSTLRVAALITNLGWPPGAIVMNGADYVHAWGSGDPSAYNVTLAPGVSTAQVVGDIRAALGPGTALAVQTARQREMEEQEASHQGLSRLTEIAVLVLIAGVLAIAASMGALVWQRRRRFARMKVQGYQRGVLWRSLVCESAILLGAGCAIGAVFGTCSQVLQSDALTSVTGFPVVISLHALIAMLSTAVVALVAVAIVALPGYRAASVRAYPYT